MQKNNLELFKEYLIAECGLSINTVNNYTYDVLHFLQYYEKTKKTPIDYINSLSISKRSIARKISTLKMYYSFLLTEKLIKKDELVHIPSPKYSVKPPKPMNLNDIKKIIQYAKNDLRLLSMLQLLYSTGMRISEMLSLKVKDIIYNKSKVRNNFIIQSKGSKERIIITDQHTTSIIEQYYTTIHNKKSIYLFPSYSSQGYLTRQNFHKLLKKIAIDCNIPLFSAHQLRHTFATTLLQNGANIMVIKELLGHSSINTTKIYTLIDNKEIQTAIQNKHPLNKKNK